ncbi:MAG: tetratricopeptide repeat protein [Muricomes sp.]
MASIKCPECNSVVDENSKECNVCGYPLEGDAADEADSAKAETALNEDSSEDMDNISEQSAQTPDMGNETSEETNEPKIVPQPDKEHNTEKNKIHFRRKSITITASVCSLIIIAILTFVLTGNMRAYAKAKDLMEKGEYTEAISGFQDLDGYKESDKLIQECNYEYGIKEIDSENYTEAMRRLGMAGTGDKVEEAKNRCKYQEALAFIEEKDYPSAIEILNSLDYEDSQDKLLESKYSYAKEYVDSKDYNLALVILEDLKYKDSEELMKLCKYNLGKELYEKKDFGNALTYLEKLNYQDSETMVDSINNNPYSLNKFVERYNAMTDIISQREGITIEKLSIDSASDNQIKTATGATVFFNRASKEVDCKYQINSFMWDKTGWVFADTNKLIADWYCCVAGFTPDTTYESATDILTGITGSAGTGIYGSTTYGDSFYNTSKTKKELTVGGSRN